MAKNVFKISSFICIFLLAAAACRSPKPAATIELSELTVARIHAAYENGDYGGKELVQAYLDRIAELNGRINALTTLNPEALSIAEKLDKEFAATGGLRPLHGIPLIVKDNINTHGLPTTAGALALADFVPQEDAFIIQRLVDAGAIILAKSNMAETDTGNSMCGPSSHNALVGFRTTLGLVSRSGDFPAFRSDWSPPSPSSGG
ncbi:MAG: amidase [Bacteroidales bacterium]|nr:amidase [Bacteroidales bacterium]